MSPVNPVTPVNPVSPVDPKNLLNGANAMFEKESKLSYNPKNAKYDFKGYTFCMGPTDNMRPFWKKITLLASIVNVNTSFKL